jgi:hypothetical protein
MSLQAIAAEFEHGDPQLTRTASVLVKVHGGLELADSPAMYSQSIATHWPWYRCGVQSCRTMLTNELFIRIPPQS